MNNKILLIGIISSIFITLVVGTYIGINHEIDMGINGPSMEPVIEKGDFVVTKYVDSIDEVEEGDIIVFDVKECNERRVFHKVIDEEDDGLITKGVNNEKPDQEMSDTTINGFTQEIIYHEPCVDPVDDDMIESVLVFHSDNDKFNQYIRNFIDMVLIE